VHPADRTASGGKAVALARLAHAGFRVPDFLCLRTSSYNEFVDRTGIRERILLELSRKDFADMRWEELWDTSLRLRNLFVTTPLPEPLRSNLLARLAAHFGETPVAVRSSAADEDGRRTSFAGLHDSYLNVRGAPAILEHVALVWASLWSHRALLYRQELRLDASRSAMAVVVQELVPADCAGVIFTLCPGQPERSVIESVYGLNEGLVDGSVQPDRWLLQRTTGEIVDHQPAPRQRRVALQAEGTGLVDLPAEQADVAPLTVSDVRAVWEMGRRAEACFGRPQDLEWALHGGTLYTLQARPITAGVEADPEDQRRWYLSLERSFDDLRRLQQKIEDEVLPGMATAARTLALAEPVGRDPEALAQQLAQRDDAAAHWRQVYWDECIPFAHGVRLFGEVYNDRLKPADPYEFVDLLSAAGTLGAERNQALAGLAQRLRDDPQARREAEAGRVPAALETAIAEFLTRYAALLDLAGASVGGEALVLRLLARMADAPARPASALPPGATDREALFLASFPTPRQAYARDLLALARASYRLRDDDNVYLGRIEALRDQSLSEAQRRLAERCGAPLDHLTAAQAIALLRDRTAAPPPPPPAAAAAPAVPAKARFRQLVGQPAGPGLASGPARVIRGPDDILAFRHGEVLVCDAVDPGVTVLVPLASAVVERRGGMLIHGAIIAREYGLPCVTGVPNATERIPTGQTVTVDGFLGIVTVDTGPLA
jgi:pyruvate,water dikinase